MNIIKKGLVAATAAVLAAGPATAQGFFNFQPADGSFYVAGFVGGGFLNDETFEGVQEPEPGIPSPAGNVPGVPAEVDLEFDADVFLGGAVGVRLPFTYFAFAQPRFELEVSYLDAGVASGAFNGGSQVFEGAQSAVLLLLNGYSDFRWSDDQAVIPYIGGGLGVGFVDSDVAYFPVAAGGPPVFALEGDDTGLTTTLAGGATWEATDHLDVYVEGRYVQIFNIDLERRFIGGGADLFNAELDDRIEGFTLTIGSRWHF